MAVRLEIEADPCWVLILDNADDLGLFGVGRQSPEQASLSTFVPGAQEGRCCGRVRDEHISGTLVGARRAHQCLPHDFRRGSPISRNYSK